MTKRKTDSHIAVTDQAAEMPVPTRHLIKTKLFSGYQRDFLKALLPEEAYTVREATEICNNYFQIKEANN